MDSNLSSKDILRPLTTIELDNLLLLYKKNYSMTSHHYISLYTQCKWNRKIDKAGGYDGTSKWKPFKKTFYTHRSGNLTNGTYVSLHWDELLSVQFYSLEESLDELKECLLQTKLIDWRSGPLITGVSIKIYDVVQDILSEVGTVVERARECHFLLLPSKLALQLADPDLPDEYVMRQLTPTDGEIIHSMWANKKESTLAYVQELTVLNKTIGIIRTSDGVLVGWIFQNDFSGLGILQVLPEEQGKGLGLILGIKLSRAIASEETIDISAFIVQGNTKSEGLLKKIGFKYSRTAMWIQCQRL